MWFMKEPRSFNSSKLPCKSWLIFLLQGILLTQGLNSGLRNCRQILYCLSYQGCPYSISFINVSVLWQSLFFNCKWMHLHKGKAMKYSHPSNSEKETNCHVHATPWASKWPTVQTKECVLVELIVGLQFLQSPCPTNYFFNGVVKLSCLFKASIRRRDEANVILQVFNALCVYSVTQSCLTLCDPMNCSPSGSSVHGILQARILEWVAISPSWESARLGDQTPNLDHWATWKALV